jgi:hypothetical protein
MQAHCSANLCVASANSLRINTESGISEVINLKWLVTLQVKSSYWPPNPKQVAHIQVKLLITNNSFCIVQRATAQSKTGIFRDCGVAEAPPCFQAGWSDCIFSLSFCSFCLLIWS